MSASDDTGAERKPSAGSVTSTPCACNYLQRASDEPDNPIVFDAKMNEYHLAHIDRAGTGRQGHSIIRHCPWCGGSAPRSKRATFFANITQAESRRLRELASGLKSVDEAIAKLGPPDEDHPNGYAGHSPATDTQPSVVNTYRFLRYTRLSNTANVMLTDYGPDRGLYVSLESKYIGESKT